MGASGKGLTYPETKGGDSYNCVIMDIIIKRVRPATACSLSQQAPEATAANLVENMSL